MTKVVYLAHPVGHGSDRSLNIASTKLWLRALVDAVDVAISIPWLPYVETLAEETHRDRGIRDDIAQLKLCNAITLVGGRVSPGMSDERDVMMRIPRPVIDLTSDRFPGILTPHNYHQTQNELFRERVRLEFARALA